MNASRALLAAVTMTALAGCVSLAPQYQRPAAPIHDSMDMKLRLGSIVQHRNTVCVRSWWVPW